MSKESEKTEEYEKHDSEKEEDLWDEQEVLSRFKQDFAAMKTEREDYETDRDTCDGQMEANTYYDAQ